MQRSYLMLLWHMHQPFYKDLAEGEIVMPWVRLHALKDYYGMVALLREFPRVHMTFNLVPSLLAQLEEYQRGEARERAMEVAFRPVKDLSPDDREALLDTAFQVNRERVLSRYSRFQELYEKTRAVETEHVARLLTPQDWLDLQVLSQLAWFDEIYLSGDPEIANLVSRGRGFSEEDKKVILQKESEIFKVILEEYRSASARGQIEISTSPFYHPILPLLCDSSAASESHPGVLLPHRVFRHPEDARDQLRMARECHERLFGHPPRGLWPSEGSVSDEALRLAAEEGFEWCATDEGVLARSLGTSFHRQADGVVTAGRELYKPHRLTTEGKEISIFFRDHQLSDLIGFVYSRMDAQTAAADLHSRIRAAARSTADTPAVISVILDGENAWEFYPRNGRDFLKAFYGRLSDDPELVAVTASEALFVIEPGSLSHIVPGSWINANFDIWIGAEEDNRAWDLLWEAREYFSRRAAAAETSKSELARQELHVAEGSDWCWWYGPEHSSALDEAFDLLYRKHLSNVYRLLGSSPPDELAVPIKRAPAAALIVPPTGRISPIVDGKVTDYFEWIGAGFYQPDERQGSMHGGQQYVERLYYGYSEQALYLLVDFHAQFVETHPKFEIRVLVDGEARARIHVPVENGNVGAVQFWRGREETAIPAPASEGLAAAFARVFELRLDFALANLRPEEKAKIQVSLWVDQLPLQMIPRQGWLELELTAELLSW